MAKDKARRKGENGTDASKCAVQDELALALRIKGWTFPQIGEELGIDQSTAYRSYRRAMDKVREITVEEAEVARDLELAKLDEIERVLRERVINPGLNRFGETEPLAGHANALMNVHERRAKLLGIDAAIKHEHSGPGGAAIPVAVTVKFDLSTLDDAELKQLRALVDKVTLSDDE